MSYFDLNGPLPKGRAVIEASAGTGKTYTLTRLLVRFLIEEGYGIQEILVVTFTNAAASELRVRIRSVLMATHKAFTKAQKDSNWRANDAFLDALIESRQEKGTLDSDIGHLMGAIADFDMASIFTIHGFCERLLRRFPVESGMPMDWELIQQDEQLLDHLARDYWAKVCNDAGRDELEFFKARKVDVETFKNIGKKALMQPILEVEPKETVHSDDSLRDEWEAAHNGFVSIWNKQRDEMVSCIREGTKREGSPGVLHGARYKDPKTRKHVAWMDQFCGSGHIGTPQNPAIEYFSQEVLERATKKGCVPPQHPGFALLDTLRIAYGRWEQVLEDRTVGLFHQWISYIKAELPRLKSAQNVCGFSDLLWEVYSGVKSPGGHDAFRSCIREAYPVALIDEFQDTNTVQWEIFQALFEDSKSSLILVGDPKQAIYRFRDADVQTYLRGRKEASATYRLGRNFRTDLLLVRGINALFLRGGNSFVHDEIIFHPAEAENHKPRLIGPTDAPLQIGMLYRDETVPTVSGNYIRSSFAMGHIARCAASQIAEMLDAGWAIHEKPGENSRPITPTDFGVLVRTKAQAREVQKALRALNIPVVTFTNESVWLSDEALEFGHLLRAIANPHRGGFIRAALSTFLVGCSGEEILATDEDLAKSLSWGLYFSHWLDLWKRRGLMAAFQDVLLVCQVPERCLQWPDGQRRITNWQHIAELLHEVDWREGLSPSQLVQWLDTRIADADDSEANHQLRLESDQDAVTVRTIHTSKGLEFSIVLCPYLWKDSVQPPKKVHPIRYHDSDEPDRVILDIGWSHGGRQDAIAQQSMERIQERMRLLYVALTRAKYRCVVYWGGFRSMQKSALGYLVSPAYSTIAHELEGTECPKMPDDEVIAEALHGLVNENSDSIGLFSLVLSPAKPVNIQALKASLQGGALSSRAEIRSQWSKQSFSSLIRGAYEGQAHPERDRDEGYPQAGEEMGEDSKPIVDERVLLADFPKGAKAGNFFHDLLEHLDFQKVDVELEELVQKTLPRHGFSGPLWGETVTKAIRKAMDTKWAPSNASICLDALSKKDRLDELAFSLSARTSEARESGGGCSVGDLSDAFASSPKYTEYAAQLNHLQFARFSGYLNGFIDLVFQWKGKFYIVDYKSNYLGNAPSDYAKTRLDTAMESSHYTLQYHLYTLALVDYLKYRIKDFNYQRHFGGVYYLYLRGMVGDEAGTGVFYDCPTPELMGAISSAVCGTRGVFR